MTMKLSRPLTIATVMLLGAATSYAQSDGMFDADPAAAKAFKQLVTSYRNRPALTVKTKMKVELFQGEISADTDEVQAQFTYSRGGAGIIKLRGFTCYFKDGVFWAVHEWTDHSYYTEEYEDNPYWTFLLNFLDIPFPHLGLLWGESDIQDVYMQLHPRTDSIVPTSVELRAVQGKQIQRLVLSSPYASMRIDIDPKSKLIASIEHEITGGDFVQNGAKIVTRYSYEYETYDKPLDDAALRFDPGSRQRVDMLATLMPPPPEVPVGPAGGGMGGGPLIGKPAPAFVLETADGQVVDLEKLRGQVVVLDFWATWCGPCRVVLPLLHDVSRWTRQEQLPVKILAVNVWEIRDPDGDTPEARREAASTFWKKQGFSVPIAMDYSDETAAAYGVSGIPTTVIIRADGVVHAYHVGGSSDYVATMKRDITAAIEALEGD
ncbi:MAG: TlpA disulfide reductase family protein [Phycisphaerales bacterium]